MMRIERPVAIAIGQAVVAGILVLIALSTAWSAVQHAFAKRALAAQAEAEFLGDAARARREARDAAQWIDDDARCVLPALDPSDPATDEYLERLIPRVPERQIADVIAARNLGRALRGAALVQAERMTGGDAALITHMRALFEARRAPLPDPPTSERRAPVDRNILEAAWTMRLRHAWRLGDARAARDAADTLRLLRPQHPAQASLQLVATTLAASATRSQIRTLAGAIPETERTTVPRGLIRLLRRGHTAVRVDDPEERIAILAGAIPSAERTGTEMAFWLSGARIDLEELAEQTTRDPSRALVTVAINRCFAGGRFDLVEKLARFLEEEEQRRRVLLAVAERTWDVAALRRLTDTPADHLPTVIAPRLTFNRIHFHVTTPSGSIPRQPIHLRIDGKPVHGNAVVRAASLLKAPIRPGADRVHLTVLLAEEEIFSETITR